MTRYTFIPDGQQFAGAEHRQMVAHGASRGTMEQNNVSPGGAKELWPTRSQTF